MRGETGTFPLFVIQKKKETERQRGEQQNEGVSICWDKVIVMNEGLFRRKHFGGGTNPKLGTWTLSRGGLYLVGGEK